MTGRLQQQHSCLPKLAAVAQPRAGAGSVGAGPALPLEDRHKGPCCRHALDSMQLPVSYAVLLLQTA